MTKITIVIDAFRAFATACYVLKHNPSTYTLATETATITALAKNFPNPLLIGKPEKGKESVKYDIPNSPTRVEGVSIKGRHVFHRTEAGAKGVLQARNSDLILVAGFTNAQATAKQILLHPESHLSFAPMGHEAITPSLEDDLCATYIQHLLEGKILDLSPYISDLRKGPGCYFFGEDQWQYPREDFDKCLDVSTNNFAIEAHVYADYARLMKCV